MIPKIKLSKDTKTGIIIPEKWKFIKEYEGLYKISNYGRIWSVRRKVPHHRWGYQLIHDKILKVGSSPNGYAIARFSKNGQQRYYTVHRIVAINFLPNAQQSPQINHKDTNKKNNRATNLEWVSAAANTRHAIKNGLRKNNYMSIEKAIAIRNHSKKMTIIQLIKKYSASYNCIRDILKQKTWM